MAPLVRSQNDGRRHDQLRPRRAERRHPAGRSRARGGGEGARVGLAARTLLRHRDRTPGPLRVDRERAPRNRRRAGDGHQRVDGGRGAPLPLHDRAGRPGDRRAALLRPHPPVAGAHRRRADRRAAGGRRHRRRRGRGRAGRRAGEPDPRDPELPQPGGLHAVGGQARAAPRARRRARVPDLRGRPVPADQLRRRAAADDALGGRRRPRDPRVVVLEDGQPRGPGGLPRRTARPDRDAGEARQRALHLAEHARRSRSCSSSAARAR